MDFKDFKRKVMDNKPHSELCDTDRDLNERGVLIRTAENFGTSNCVSGVRTPVKATTGL